jgi:hypothetical protein
MLVYAQEHISKVSAGAAQGSVLEAHGELAQAAQLRSQAALLWQRPRL